MNTVLSRPGEAGEDDHTTTNTTDEMASANQQEVSSSLTVKQDGDDDVDEREGGKQEDRGERIITTTRRDNNINIAGKETKRNMDGLPNSLLLGTLPLTTTSTVRFRIHSLALYRDSQLVVTRRFVDRDVLPSTPSRLRGPNHDGFFTTTTDGDDDEHHDDKEREWVFREWPEQKTKWIAAACPTRECLDKDRDWARAGCLQVLKDVEALVRRIDKKESLGTYLLLMLPFGIPAETDADLVLSMSFPQDDGKMRPVWNPQRFSFPTNTTKNTNPSSFSFLKTLSNTFGATTSTITSSQHMTRFVIMERICATHITSALEDAVSVTCTVTLKLCLVPSFATINDDAITVVLTGLDNNDNDGGDSTITLMHESVQRVEKNRITLFPTSPPPSRARDDGKASSITKYKDAIELLHLTRTIHVKDSTSPPGPLRDVSYRVRRISNNNEEHLQILLRVVLKQAHAPPNFIIDHVLARLILPCTDVLDTNDLHVSSGSLETDGIREIVWSMTGSALCTQGFALLSGFVKTKSVKDSYQDDLFIHETSCALFSFTFRGSQAAALPQIDFDYRRGAMESIVVDPRVVEANGLDFCVWSPFGQNRATGALPVKSPLF